MPAMACDLIQPRPPPPFARLSELGVLSDHDDALVGHCEAFPVDVEVDTVYLDPGRVGAQV